MPSPTDAPSTLAERDAFAVIERMALRFSLADRVLISTADVELRHPLQAQALVRSSGQPGLTFRFDPRDGYSPLLKDRPTLVILAAAATS